MPAAEGPQVLVLPLGDAEGTAPTQVRHNKLIVEVERVFGREKGMAGRDQITTILGHEGVPVAPARLVPS